MTELKLISNRSIEEGIQTTQQNLITFETKYGMPTNEFIQRYENDELDETLEFGEWVGEYRMLCGLMDDANQSILQN